MLPSDLKGKACLITGSSRGIGAAVARGLGVCGAHVAVHYNNGREEAEAVAADIARASGKAIVLHGDVTETGTVERLLAETVRGFGRLDILINNAGDVIGATWLPRRPTHSSIARWRYQHLRRAL